MEDAGGLAVDGRGDAQGIMDRHVGDMGAGTVPDGAGRPVNLGILDDDPGDIARHLFPISGDSGEGLEGRIMHRKLFISKQKNGHNE